MELHEEATLLALSIMPDVGFMVCTQNTNPLGRRRSAECRRYQVHASAAAQIPDQTIPMTLRHEPGLRSCAAHGRILGLLERLPMTDLNPASIREPTNVSRTRPAHLRGMSVIAGRVHYVPGMAGRGLVIGCRAMGDYSLGEVVKKVRNAARGSDMTVAERKGPSLRYGPRMMQVTAYVRDHPGESSNSVSYATGPHGIRIHGQKAVNRALSAGLIEDRGIGRAFQLHITDTGQDALEVVWPRYADTHTWKATDVQALDPRFIEVTQGPGPASCARIT